jgi:hypothetical protein
MRAAFLKACEAPQVRDVGPDAMGIVAEKILDLAQAGETNPERLYTGALRRFRSSSVTEATVQHCSSVRSGPRPTTNYGLPDGRCSR